MTLTNDKAGQNSLVLTNLQIKTQIIDRIFEKIPKMNKRTKKEKEYRKFICGKPLDL